VQARAPKLTPTMLAENKGQLVLGCAFLGGPNRHPNLCGPEMTHVNLTQHLKFYKKTSPRMFKPCASKRVIAHLTSKCKMKG
jgi:hypothetical protein